MCTTFAGPIQSCLPTNRRQKATRRATAKAAHPTQARYSSRPRRAVSGSPADRWEGITTPRRRPGGQRATSRLRYVSAIRIVQGLMATGGWDPAFIIARRRYLRQHPEG